MVVTYSLGMLSSLVAVWNLKDSNFWELQDLHIRNQEIKVLLQYLLHEETLKFLSFQ